MPNAHPGTRHASRIARISSAVRSIAVASLALLLAAPALQAQGGALAARIAAVRDNEVRFSFPARSGACGDGRNVVGFGRTLTVHPSMESYGSWSGVTCVPGPARVSLTMRGGEVQLVRAHVGGSWNANVAATDLGTVSGADASAWLLALAARAEVTVARAALLPAAIADGVQPAPTLLAIGRDTSRPSKVRTRAVHLAGAVGDASTVPELVRLATSGDWSNGKNTRRSDDGDPGPGSGVAAAAMGALAELPDPAGLQALMPLARHRDPAVRKAAVFWLGQGEDAAAHRVVREVAEDEKEPEGVRAAAIFALGQGDEPTDANRAWMRQLFGRLESERLRDQVLMSMSQQGTADDGRWVLGRARDGRLSIESRRKAVFWAGQGRAPVADMVALYRGVPEPKVREHVIFALSQRDERPATDALIDIAKGDADREMRKKALFWLSQKDDPRVTRLIADMITQEEE